MKAILIKTKTNYPGNKACDLEDEEYNKIYDVKRVKIFGFDFYIRTVERFTQQQCFNIEEFVELDTIEL